VVKRQRLAARTSASAATEEEMASENGEEIESGYQQRSGVKIIVARKIGYRKWTAANRWAGKSEHGS